MGRGAQCEIPRQCGGAHKGTLTKIPAAGRALAKFLPPRKAPEASRWLRFHTFARSGVSSGNLGDLPNYRSIRHARRCSHGFRGEPWAEYAGGEPKLAPPQSRETHRRRLPRRRKGRGTTRSFALRAPERNLLMSETLVSAISRMLTPEIVGKMASASGLDRGTAQSAVSAFVPAILGGLSDLAAKPGGARQIADAVAEQPAGILTNLAATLTGAQSADKGGGLLASLLGGGVLNTLVSTLSRFVGIGEGSTRTLMGLLTPLILGTLGREQRAQGLEASGLARMLMGQKDQIAAAMPAGLSELLGS